MHVGGYASFPDNISINEKRRYQTISAFSVI